MPILSISRSDYKFRHEIEEYVVVLAASDLTPHGLMQKTLLGFALDVDFIMINQIMTTFRRQNGYMINKQTSEIWSWHKDHFTETLLSRKNDFGGSYALWIINLLFFKVCRLLNAFFSFMSLSLVNGLAIRVALLCSNVVIFPILYFIKNFSPQQINDG